MATRYSLLVLVIAALSNDALAQLFNQNPLGGIINGPQSSDFDAAGYLPPKPDIDPESSNPGDTIVVPITTTTTTTTTPRPITRAAPLIVQPIIGAPPQLGCAAAMQCVEEQYCTMLGIMSETPVTMTPAQLLRRVPMVDCRNPDNGVVGKCCRDPNYVDPWPAGNLPANYNGGFDEQGFPKFLNISGKLKAKTTVSNTIVQQPALNLGASLNQVVVKKPVVIAQPKVTVQQTQFVVPKKEERVSYFTQPIVVPENQVTVEKYQVRQPVNTIQTTKTIDTYQTIPGQINTQYTIQQGQPILGLGQRVEQTVSSDIVPVTIEYHTPGAHCGLLNKVQYSGSLSDIDAAFGEIPWQAMVLNNAEKNLIASGVFIAPDVVMTSAHAIYGRNASEISVKAGEYKLGYELKHEEPLAFEIVQVKFIMTHPKYVSGSFAHDVAILVLEHGVKLDQHIDTICLPESNIDIDYIINSGRRCIATGWGKEVLAVHAAGALMHKLNVDLLTSDMCRMRNQHAEASLDIDDSVVCAKPDQFNHNMCQVDVGGPLTCQREDGYWELVGIYSQETGCQPTNQLATFAKIDFEWVTYSLKIIREETLFIQAQVQQNVGQQVITHTQTNVIQEPAIVSYGPTKVIKTQTFTQPKVIKTSQVVQGPSVVTYGKPQTIQYKTHVIKQEQPQFIKYQQPSSEEISQQHVITQEQPQLIKYQQPASQLIHQQHLITQEQPQVIKYQQPASQVIRQQHVITQEQPQVIKYQQPASQVIRQQHVITQEQPEVTKYQQPASQVIRQQHVITQEQPQFIKYQQPASNLIKQQTQTIEHLHVPQEPVINYQQQHHQAAAQQTQIIEQGIPTYEPSRNLPDRHFYQKPGQTCDCQAGTIPAGINEYLPPVAV